MCPEALILCGFQEKRRSNETGCNYCFPAPHTNALRFLCSLQILLHDLVGAFPSQDLAGVVVHPFLSHTHLTELHLIKVCAFWEKPPNYSVHVFIAATLMR